ncbi:carbohydrate ABC transporter permease [Candidatus Mycoplasma mahonii]|uniref:carbohydrate ABC transporter permease n=1 Tax=Candidatus Mycoplasma mahonii TaxID=3004105 RepID=UPI0026F083FD|nr:sugar ABC transporter permease [Candidatus Mycoplasma mahonii]WKX02471.1 sugar ABC transporter permease [Candidatus Mycoplasma mahonii]
MFLKQKLSRGARTKDVDLLRVNKRTKLWIPLLLLLPAFTILTIFTIITFFNTSKDAFQARVDPYSMVGTKWSLDTFRYIIEDEVFGSAIKNSLIYAIITVPLVLIISAVVASAISSLLRKRMSGFFQTVFFLPYVTSAISISLFFVFIFDYDSGLMNKMFNTHKLYLNDTEGHGALYVMVTMGVWKGLAFNILIFTTAMLGVEKDHYKAAAIDGAGPIKQFLQITLPSISRTTNFLITMGIIGSIKVFPLALFNNDPAIAQTNGGMSLLLYVFKFVSVSELKRAGAASVFLVIIAISFSIFVKSSMKLLVKSALWIGEKRVSFKIKNQQFKK